MKLRSLAVLVSAIAIASAPVVFAVTGGGIPSFLQLLGLGLNTAPQTAVPITVQNLSPNVTAIQAKNDTAHDAEILVTTSTAGNAQYRATNFGGTNWSWGNLRSGGDFDICPAATLTGCVFDLAAGGNLTLTGSIQDNGASNVQIAAKAGASGNFSQLVAQSAASVSGTLCISDTAGICGTNAPAGGASLGGSATTLALLQTTITAPNASTVPWTPAQTSGTFSSTMTTGCTTTPSVNISWTLTGKVATLFVPVGFTCTSNNTGFTLNSLPAALQPTTNHVATFCCVTDNGAQSWGTMVMGASSASFFAGVATVSGTKLTDGQSAWTGSGNKGIQTGSTVVYTTQ